MMEAMNPQREGASLDESFCVISPDGSSMVPPPSGARQVPTSTVGAIPPPTNTASYPQHSSMASHGQFPPGYATPPAPSPNIPPQDPAGPPPPMSGPYSSGERLSALRPKHKPSYPPPVQANALFQPAGGPEQQAGSYQALAQGHAVYPSPTAGVQGQTTTGLSMGQSSSVYGSPASQTYDSWQPGSDNGDNSSGLWGWVAQATNSVVESAQKIVSNPDLLMESAQKLGRNIVDKTKSSMDTVLTTLDPQMADSQQMAEQVVLELAITSAKSVKVDAISAGFLRVFPRVHAHPFICPSGVAPQPVGFQSGVQGAKQRIQYLRSMHSQAAGFVAVSVENFVAELTPGSFYDMACVALQDSARGIELSVFSQAVPVPSQYVSEAQQRTPQGFALRESGLAVKCASLVAKDFPGTDIGDMHSALCGVSRKYLIQTAASVLAGLYQARLRQSGGSMSAGVPSPTFQPMSSQSTSGYHPHGMSANTQASAVVMPPPEPQPTGYY